MSLVTFIVAVCNGETALLAADSRRRHAVRSISNRPESPLTSLREMQAARVKRGLAVFNLHFVATLARVFVRLVLWRVIGERPAPRAMDWGRRLGGKAAY